jgi:hypothetical protein
VKRELKIENQTRRLLLFSEVSEVCKRVKCLRGWIDTEAEALFTTTRDYCNDATSYVLRRALGGDTQIFYVTHSALMEVIDEGRP